MAAPETCVITFPPDGWVAGAAPDNTATLDVNGTTDATTPVEVFDDAGSAGTTTSSAQGAWTVAAVVLELGDNVLMATAGTDPDTTDSTVHTVTVVDTLAAVAKADDRTLQWYLNWLAAGNVRTPSLLDMKDAACDWAGVSRAQYSLIGALNVKAGNAVGRWQRNMNMLLNQLAQQAEGKTFPDYRVAWRGNLQAAHDICVAVQA